VFPKVKDRLFATFLLLSLFPTLFICFLFYEEAKEAVFEQYKTSTQGHLKLADERISYFFQMLQNDTSELANDWILRMADGTRERSAPAGKFSDEESQEVQMLFARFARTHKIVGDIHLLRNDFSILSYQQELGWSKEINRPIKFYRESFGRKEDSVWLLTRQDKPDGHKSMYMAQRVKNINGMSFGLLLVEIKMERLSDWIRTKFTPEDNELMVVSPAGKIMIHTDAAMIGQRLQDLPEYEAMDRGMRNPTEEGMFSFLMDGKMMYGFHQVALASGSSYFEWISGEDITRPLDRLQLILLCTILLVVGFSAYVAHRLSRWIGKPIYTLVSATDTLLSGDFTIRVPIQGMEELTELEKKFNQMAEQMHTLIGRECEYMRQSLDQIVRSFYLAVEMKDPYTAGHTERVTQYALIIFDHMEENDSFPFSRDDLRFAGLMHDIGKVAIPDHVLLKTGKLTAEEYERMKLHSSIGADIVEQIESLAHVSPGVRHHHERWDGRGYPDQLKGEEIPLIGRILAVADTFDAMTSTRSYRTAMNAQEAYEEILRCSKKQFDPRIVAVFKKAYESGSFTVKPSMDHKDKELEKAEPKVAQLG
jgi:HAMP domain-containing protein